MKILCCIPTLDYGGAERQLSYLASELARMGHEVHVASRRGGPHLDRMLSAGVAWHPLNLTEQKNPNRFGRIRLVRVIRTFVRLVVLMRRVKPDVVQTILAPMDILGGAAALLSGTPWSVKECSSALLYTTYRRYWFRNLFVRLADAVVSNSMHAYNYWRPARRGRPLHRVPNGLPLVEIAACEPAAVNGINLRPNEKLVLYAGRIDIGKNVEALIAALARISAETPYVALICGEGPHRRRVERMAHELGIADRIVFTGYVDNLWGLMKRADVFVSFSRCEGCPNVILEAMACGCPVVVSDISGHREILDEKTALFVRPDEPAEAARAIEKVMKEGGAARRRARVAQARVVGWTVASTARGYERIYQRLLSDARRRQIATATATEPRAKEGELNTAEVTLALPE